MLFRSALARADVWGYASLARPQGAPRSDAHADWAASIYRGIVPAANILGRDFAVNGALVRGFPSSYPCLSPPSQFYLKKERKLMR